MNNGFEQGVQGIRKDWEAVGSYLSTAMQEVATDLDGKEFAASVADEAVSDDVLPNPAALKLLEETYPGSTETVFARMHKIQQEAHQRELAENRKPSLRKYGKVMLEGFANFNLFGNPPQRYW